MHFPKKQYLRKVSTEAFLFNIPWFLVPLFSILFWILFDFIFNITQMICFVESDVLNLFTLRFVDPLIDRLTDWSIDRFMIYWLIDWLIDWLVFLSFFQSQRVICYMCAGRITTSRSTSSSWQSTTPCFTRWTHRRRVQQHCSTGRRYVFFQFWGKDVWQISSLGDLFRGRGGDVRLGSKTMLVSLST